MRAKCLGLPTVGIGGADQQDAAGLEDALNLIQQRQRLLEVFDHFKQGDGVKTGVGKGSFVQQTWVHFQPSRLCRGGCFGGRLHAFCGISQFHRCA